MPEPTLAERIKTATADYRTKATALDAERKVLVGQVLDVILQNDYKVLQAQLPTGYSFQPGIEIWAGPEVERGAGTHMDSHVPTAIHVSFRLLYKGKVIPPFPLAQGDPEEVGNVGVVQHAMKPAFDALKEKYGLAAVQAYGEPVYM